MWSWLPKNLVAKEIKKKYFGGFFLNLHRPVCNSQGTKKSNGFYGVKATENKPFRIKVMNLSPTALTRLAMEKNEGEGRVAVAQPVRAEQRWSVGVITSLNEGVGMVNCGQQSVCAVHINHTLLPLVEQSEIYRVKLFLIITV